MIRYQKRNGQLVELIQKNPGIQFRELMRFTGMKNGVLSHYLGKLERSGTVQVQRKPRQTSYYPLEISEIESKVIKSLRRETPRRILHILMLNKEGLEFNEIVSQVSRASSTVSFYLSQLIGDDIVQIYLENRKRKYIVKERNLVDRLIEDYQPGLLDKPITGFEDIINSL